jgi:hypothetical protein
MDGGMVRREYGNGWWTRRPAIQYLARGGVHVRHSFAAVPRGGVRIEHARHRLEVACSFELCCDCEHVVRLPGCRTASCLPRRFLLVGDWSAGEKMRIACVARLVQADAASCGGLAGANLTRVWGLVAAPKRAFARTAPVFGGKSAPVDCRQQRQRRRDAAARN